MSEKAMYNQFSQDYDRFVDWEARLGSELPFLIRQLETVAPNRKRSIRILDAACGTGQHALALTKVGFSCVGADISEGMIVQAKGNAEIAGIEVDFKQVGFGELTSTFGVNAFDAVLSLGNSLPHLLDEDSLTAALRDFYEVLRPTGKLIVQNRNFDQVLTDRLRWLAPQTFRDGDRTWIFERFYDFDQDGKITFNVIILTGEEQEDFSHQIIQTRLWPITEASLVNALQVVGFTELAEYGDLQGSIYNPRRSGNLVIEARVSR